MTTTLGPLFGSPEFSDFAGDLEDNDTPDIPEDVAPKDVPRTEHVNIVDTPVEMPTGTGKKRRSPLQIQLEGTYQMLGTGVFMFDNQLGVTIMNQAESCAESLADVASKNPAVKRALEGALATSAWGAVIAAHLPIAVHVATKYVPQIRERYMGDVRRAEQDHS